MLVWNIDRFGYVYSRLEVLGLKVVLVREIIFIRFYRRYSKKFDLKKEASSSSL